MVARLAFVHRTPTVLGWRSSLARKWRRSVVAGALALSKAMVVLITLLVWSEISKSFQSNFLDTQNNTLLKAVLGLGRKKVDDAFPMVESKLDDYSSWVCIFIVDYEKFKCGSVACHARKYVHMGCALWRKGVSSCKLLREYLWDEMSEEKTKQSSYVPSFALG